jgi:hypothetical protein
MKKNIFIALIPIPIIIGIIGTIGIANASCSAKEPKDYMIFSGEIANYNKKIDKIYIYYFQNKSEISINENGSFSDTLRIKTGYYHIYYNNKGTIVYLNKTNDLKLFFNLENTTASNRLNINKFEGKDVAINTYLQEKQKLVLASNSEEYEELGRLAENEYLAKYKKHKIKLEKLLGSSGIKDEFFLKLEFKNIYYDYFSAIRGYELHHQSITQNYDFKVSDSFPYKELRRKFDFNDLIAYENIQAYPPMVRLVCYTLAREKYGNKGVDIEFLDIVNTNITNKIIKSDLLYENAMRSGRRWVSKFDHEYYRKAMTYITNEEYKKEIKKLYEELKFSINKIAKGNFSPKFENYENYKGGTTSLDDFKGKYTYLHIWAAPC